jgi:hypothetical protein
VKLILFLRLQGLVGDLVRMAGENELAICLLDGRGIGVLVYPKSLVVVWERF